MTEKMDLGGAKRRLLHLAHDLELADMPTQADALRCLARGPTFTAGGAQWCHPIPVPPPEKLMQPSAVYGDCPIAPIIGTNQVRCWVCDSTWPAAAGIRGCKKSSAQPAT